LQAGFPHAARAALRGRPGCACGVPEVAQMSTTTAPTTLWVRRPAGVAWAGWLRTVDHKEIGVLYMGMALAFLVFGSVEAGVIRLQLALPDNPVVAPEIYDQIFTLHGVTMIFLVAIPVLVGFMN